MVSDLFSVRRSKCSHFIFDAFEFEPISILSLGCWLKVDWQMSLVDFIMGTIVRIVQK